MSKDWALLLAVTAFIGGMFLGGLLCADKQYRAGQIDAINGKWKYKQVIKSDTTYKAIN